MQVKKAEFAHMVVPAVAKSLILTVSKNSPETLQRLVSAEIQKTKSKFK
jgi:hypothetical protein